MHELYELKEMLMKELEEYGGKGEMTAGSLEVVDKLTHAIKNLCKIIEACEEEEGGSSYYDGGRSSYEGGGSSYRRSYAGGGSGQSRRSYARGGRGGRSYARGDRYSRANGGMMYSGAEAEEMVMELRELMEDAPDERTKKEFQKFIQKIEGM